MLNYSRNEDVVFNVVALIAVLVVVLLLIKTLLWSVEYDERRACKSKFCANSTTPLLVDGDCRCLDAPIESTP